MSKNSKALSFIIGFFLIIISLIIYRYEKLLTKIREEENFSHVDGGIPISKKYTANEIIYLIKKSSHYLGDSISIFDNGQISSSNPKFQGTIAAVISSKDNMDIVRSNMESNKLPIQFNIYELASIYYVQQYPNEFKTKH
ncbi:MAG: hypothetical protein JST58_07095 [Bacteroidetes bacterium]|nr:hypothetical protein [Bacteroidota bacterium]